MTETPRIVAITPGHLCDPGIAVAALRAGAIAILDMGPGSDPAQPDRAAAMRRLATEAAGKHCGVRIDRITGLEPAALLTSLPGKVQYCILAGVSLKSLAQERQEARRIADQVYLEVSSLEMALAAEQAGYDGVLLKGHEAGGRVGTVASYILLQLAYRRLGLPYWIQGGIGLHTAAAAALAGASGIALCEQFWATAEGPGNRQSRDAWRSFDGSESVYIGDQDAGFRLSSRSARDKLRALEAGAGEWPSLLAGMFKDGVGEALIPLGQDIAFCGHLAGKFGTTGRVIGAYRDALSQGLETARKQQALAADSAFAREHHIHYPILQGPMTRVSDNAPFAKAVADAGGLPFIALALLQGPQLRKLLEETRDALKDRAWGVGILGFVPLALRQEQLKVIEEIRPPYALVAGGRPSQAQELEKLGIAAYLHAPSPGLLVQFIKEGARRFIFEGNECGGHVGPRTSFVLWELAVQALLDADIDAPESLSIVFAGGIHDALSGAMAAVIAAPLSERGIRVGVQMGSAYLFTREAVQTGAILPEFQEQAIRCSGTALLRSGPGQATRCAKTLFCDEFEQTRNDLLMKGAAPEEILEALERLNIGRLRIAAKGIARGDGAKAGDAAYMPVDFNTQRREGLYMMGDVATLREEVIAMADLHGSVCEDAMNLLAEGIPNPTPGTAGPAAADHDIAVVGMACLLPGAADIQQYWRNILECVDCISEVEGARWRPEDFFDADRLVPDKVYSKWGGFLKDIQFDPTRYGMPPVSLSAIEPMQLLALEVARQALADAGLDRLDFPREKTAVIFGAGGMHDLGIDYIFRTMLGHYLPRVPGLSDESRQGIRAALLKQLPEWNEDSFPGVLGNVLAGRVANRLNLNGTNFTVDAACASSLAALSVGVAQLRSGQADLALVGAADGTNNAVSFMAFAKTQALSPRGHCRPFDDSADGIAISEGVAALVLKRLADAERDGDRVYAVIKGVGSSSDGRARSLTAPHPQGQVLAVQRAYADAGVAPDSVQLIEAHGTGTAVGDKSEIECLNLAFSKPEGPYQYCAVGSVKSMIGHTKVASGLAGMIKSVLALRNRVLPPTAGVESPNHHVDFSRSAFYINSEARPWLKPADGPRRCGVSAFGFGGTNFHVVLEEYTRQVGAPASAGSGYRPAQIFMFSAPDKTGLAGQVERLSGMLENPAHIDFDQLALLHFLGNRQAGSGAANCRLGIVCGTAPELNQKLAEVRSMLAGGEAPDGREGIYYQEGDTAAGGVCFLFPGQGSQKTNMLRDLAVAMPAMHAAFEEADAELSGQLERPLSNYIYPLPVFADSERQKQQAELNDTRIAQPGLGAAELAALDLLARFGLAPDFTAGHSYGEYVALCAAGVISRSDLIRLSYRRGQIAAEAGREGGGGMLAVQADAAAVLNALDFDGLELANLNAPDQTVLAGPSALLDRAAQSLKKSGLNARKLPVTAAFHTSGMSGAAGKLAGVLETVTFNSPDIPVYSNTLATAYPESAAEVRALLARHMAEPVRFVDEVRNLHQAGARFFVEVGPGRVLSGLVSRILAGRPHVVSSLEMSGRHGMVQLAHLLAQAATHGLAVDLSAWFAGQEARADSMPALAAQAAAKAKPGPMIWRVNGDRAAPWHQRPASARTEAGLAPSSLSLTLERNPVMKDSFPPPAAGPQQPTADENLRGSVMQQVQMAMLQFIELQRAQQQIMQRLLDIQEQLLSGQAAPVAPQGGNEPAPAAVAAGRNPAAPPAPVLPRLVVTTPGAPAAARPVVATPVVQPISAAAPQPAVSGDGGSATPEEFQRDLIRTVSERTGYPPEMLDLDAHMEADLGIDSIKRVEIFSALKEHHNLLAGTDEETVLEELAGLKTIRKIVEWYEGNRTKGSVPTKKTWPPASFEHDELPGGEPEETATPVKRYELRPAPALLDEAAGEVEFPLDQVILIAGESPALSAALHALFAASGYKVRQILPGKRTQEVVPERIEVDFGAPDSLALLPGLVRGEGERVGALINLALAVGDESAGQYDVARRLFMLAKAFEGDLKECVAAGGGWLVNVTSLDGRFGLGGGDRFQAGAGGAAGVAKSLGREIRGLRVKCIDVDPDMDPHMLVAQVLAELGSADPEVEVGLAPDGRIRLALSESPSPAATVDLGLDGDSIVLVTGGASGITAEFVKAVAERDRPHFIVVGRSPLPAKEPAAWAGIADPGALRTMLIDEARSKDAQIRPADIERRLSRLLKDREIRATLEAVERSGARVSYHALDIRDAAAFGRLIDDVYLRHGRLDGVIHGAGLIEDKLVRDKSPESFDRVFDTKVVPAAVMADKLQQSGLKFVLFLSSVAGRFGNVGQCDYSAANEVLNKLADRLAAQWPEVRVRSINWGPWDSGMVTPGLRDLYAAKGIGLVSRRSGVALGLREISRGAHGPAEVVIAVDIAAIQQAGLGRAA